MRGIMGVLWTLGGALAGLVVGLLVGMAIVKLGNVTSREGAAGYRQHRARARRGAASM